MKKYSEIAPRVRAGIEEINKDFNRKIEINNITELLKKYNVNSIKELPSNIKKDFGF